MQAERGGVGGLGRGPLAHLVALGFEFRIGTSPQVQSNSLSFPGLGWEGQKLQKVDGAPGIA